MAFQNFTSSGDVLRAVSTDKPHALTPSEPLRVADVFQSLIVPTRIAKTILLCVIVILSELRLPFLIGKGELNIIIVDKLSLQVVQQKSLARTDLIEGNANDNLRIGVVENSAVSDTSES